MPFIAFANLVGFAFALVVHVATLSGHGQAVATPGIFQGLLFGAFALAYPLIVQLQRDRLDAVALGQTSRSFFGSRLGRLPAWAKVLWVIVCLYALATTATGLQRLDRASPPATMASAPRGVTPQDHAAKKQMSSEQFAVVMGFYSSWWLAFYLGLGLLALALGEQQPAASPSPDGPPPQPTDVQLPPDRR